LLDLSRAAADFIGITRLGVARVELEILEKEAKP
jgi:rare lipoprotein A (peptidoglycan hydrolase)